MHYQLHIRLTEHGRTTEYIFNFYNFGRLKFRAERFTKVVLGLYGQARQDPSNSLEVGFTLAGVLLLFSLLQFLLWRIKVLKVDSIVDKIAMITASPLFPVIFIAIGAIISTSNSPSSTYEFNLDNYRYQIVYYDYPNLHRKRIEVYKSVDTVNNLPPFHESDKWIKDSIWLYFSKTGDTIKKEYYRNDSLINSTSANIDRFAKSLVSAGGGVLRKKASLVRRRRNIS